MIVQGGIKLELDNKNVQAVIDFDTGLIGLTEISKTGQVTEYYYNEGPKEFKIALFEKLQQLMETKPYANFKISIKNTSC